MKWGQLQPMLVNQVRMLRVQPTILQRLAVKLGAGIRRGQRDLDRVRVDFTGEADRLLDRLFGLARQPQNEGAVDGDPQIVTVAGESPRPIRAACLS